MTTQRLFDECAYRMLAHGDAPRESFPGRVYGREAHLLEDLETIHRERPPEEWPDALRKTARDYQLKESNA